MGPRARHTSVEDRRVRRKLIKHLVEKKRRGRINQCLDELRCLVLEALHRQPEQYEKMEKADILDMTVRYLRHTRHTRHTTTSMPMTPTPHSAPKCQPSAAGPAHIKSEPGTPLNEPATKAQFNSGYRACVHEIAAFLDSYPGLEEGMKKRLMTRLQTQGTDNTPKSQVPDHTPTSRHYMSAAGPSMDIQCTLSLHSHTSPVTPQRHMYSPCSLQPGGYLQFTPSRSTDAGYSPECVSTPTVHRKRCTSSASSSAVSSNNTLQAATSSPMWRPW